jgi:hypothetical protein
MNKQTSSVLMMVRPAHFGFNPETAENNYFQKKIEAGDVDETAKQARDEFDSFVDVLRMNDIEVVVFEDTIAPKTPDAVFPNNWISFHEDGTVVTYPMFAKSRRPERRNDILQYFMDNYKVRECWDLGQYEEENQFLEGTGSMILDRASKIAYACKSERTNEQLFKEFCSRFEYKPILFNSNDASGQPIYHTNVIMCVGTGVVIVCLESVNDPNERRLLKESILASEKEIVEISLEQVHAFAGNMLQVENKKGELFIIMSRTALDALDHEQKEKIGSQANILAVQIPLIEQLGGGSARCMMAEVFLEKHN